MNQEKLAEIQNTLEKKHGVKTVTVSRKKSYKHEMLATEDMLREVLCDLKIATAINDDNFDVLQWLLSCTLKIYLVPSIIEMDKYCYTFRLETSPHFYIHGKGIGSRIAKVQDVIFFNHARRISSSTWVEHSGFWMDVLSIRGTEDEIASQFPHAKKFMMEKLRMFIQGIL